jgi:membrane protein implicated in regulation of membrane protease activity
MVFWLILGLVLITAELFLAELVAGSLGVAALIVAVLAWLQLPSWVQVLVWAGLSPVFLLLARRWIPQKDQRELQESREARALGAILPGQKGRVVYLGSTWPARCSLPNLAIEDNQDLYVVERQGNTLVVIPAHLLTNSTPE